ncbi:MAG: SDR family oxidoreductase [Gemmatimonadales bacterium]
MAGKIVIVTGAGRGIGEAIAKLFAAEGALVTVNARTEDHAQRVVAEIAAAGGTAHSVVADIGSLAGVTTVVERTVERFGAIDVLIHNAGIYPFQMLEEMADSDWNRVLEVNLTSAFRLTKACLPHLKRRGGGRVLFTSSVTGNRTGMVGVGHYCASKAGMNGFMRAMAVELAPYHITVNGVEPGLVLTPGVEGFTTAAEREAMTHFVPLKRWGTPADMAHAMLYLASAGASYVTGQTIIVDGGALLPENGALMT